MSRNSWKLLETGAVGGTGVQMETVTVLLTLIP
jgi:hypothetical protein